MAKLTGLRPERVFSYFEDICAIPHGSGNTRAISDYCAAFAAAHGLSCHRDAHHNVIIRKPASAGYETHEPVILQGHLDMVCEKEPDCPLDLARDGLRLRVEGDRLSAEGTTLGGDDGIAVAMILAILEDDRLPHPPLEAVLTVDEEVGMLGAAALDAAEVTGRTLINLDSEEEGILTVGCAGGTRVDLHLPIARTAPVGTDSPVKAYRLTVDGLIGGHSGVGIDKGRLNANVLMGRLLASLPACRIAALRGGLKDNAIPRRCEAVIRSEADVAAIAEAFVKANRLPSDPDLTVTVEPLAADAITEECDETASARMIALLNALPNGVMTMSRHLNGLVETSLNLGVTELSGDGLRLSFAVRSMVEAERQALGERLAAIAGQYGAQFSTYGEYPAWEYREHSRLQDTMIAVFRERYGRAPQVTAVHAGLECGILCEKLPGLDAVSCGPDLADVHTTRERLSIASVGRTYDYLCAVLERL